ncbi:hypothetical protein MMC18_001745 [Xylographa bjoerkii]|nr:hypothetical protein [Xylographa bjoerkii]
MPPPTHAIHPLLAADLPTIAQFMFASQLPQPPNQFLFLHWPDEPAQTALYSTGLEAAFTDPHTAMYKATDARSGALVAHLILTRKPSAAPAPAHADPLPPAAAAAAAPPAGVNPAFHAVLTRLLATVQAGMQGVDHLVLSSIFVEPASRNRGLGARLVRFATEEAARAGVPLFLASVPSARGFYVKQGFEERRAADVDLREWGVEGGGWGVYRLYGMVKGEGEGG